MSDKNEVILRAILGIHRHPDWERLTNLASALETAHHALCTVAGLSVDEDFGDDFWQKTMDDGKLIWDRCCQVRERIKALEDTEIAAAHKAAKRDQP